MISLHSFCMIEGMEPVEPKSRMQSSLINAAIFGILILVWVLVTTVFLVLRIVGEKRMAAFLGLPRKTKVLFRESGTT